MSAHKLLLGKMYCVHTVKAIRWAGYSNFGHKPVPKPRLQTVWEFAVAGGFCTSIYYCLRYFSLVSGGVEMPANLQVIRSGSDSSDNTEQQEDLNDGFGEVDISLLEPIDESKVRPTFKDNKINAYENRIRKFSNPDKVFRYFATIKTTKECSLPNTVLMTPSDFLRAITYDRRQPAGLDLDRFRRLNPDSEYWTEAEKPLDIFPKSSIFTKIPPWDGLLTYNDFLILLVLTSIPQDHLKYVFRMVDINENGHIDEKEFNQVLKSLIGNSYEPGGLLKVFFGPAGHVELDAFLKFFRELRDELCWIEFHRVSNGANTIDAWQFCQCVLAYVHKTELRQEISLRALSRLRHHEDVEITFDEYLNFVHFVERLPEVLRFTEVYKFGLDVETLRGLAKNAFGIRLSDSVLKVIFAMFDENEDGKLNQGEFFSVLRAIHTRGPQASRQLVYRNGYERLVGICKSCVLCAFQVLVQEVGVLGKTVYGYFAGQPMSSGKG